MIGMIIKNCKCNLCDKPLYRTYNPSVERWRSNGGYSEWYHPIPKDGDACYHEWYNGSSNVPYEVFGVPPSGRKTEKVLLETRQIQIYIK